MGRPIVRSAAALLTSVALLSVSASGTPTETKLAPSETAAQAHYGHVVALDADTAVVASNNGSSSPDTGSAFVFVRSGANWAQQGKLVAGIATSDNEFGESVAVHGDTVVVGAPYDDVNGTNTGSAFVFVRTGVAWSEQQKLTASDAGQGQGDKFGSGVAVDGDTVVVGSPGDHTPSLPTGSAYVFVRSGATWTQQQKIIASDAGFNDGFGFAVAVRGDTLLVGSRADDDSGSVYVYVRVAGVWSFQQKLVADDAGTSDGFGWSVGLSGETAVVGSPYLGVPSATKHGSAYVFVRSGTTWTQQAKLTASDATINKPQFGISVSVSGDTVVAGAHLDDEGAVDSGSAYVFSRSGALWTEVRKLTASDAATLDYLGQSAAVSGDTVVAGAIGRDDAGSASGAAYVFEGLAGGGGGGRHVSIDSFLLPKSVVVRTNTKSPAKSKVTISGVVDEGAVDPCWTEPLTLELGTKTFSSTGMMPKGRSFEHVEPGLLFRVTPARTASSRGTFLIVRTADLTNEVNRDGTLHLRVVGTRVDAEGTVILAKGKYALGKIRGKLVQPCWFPQSMVATLKGSGKDKVSMVMGFESAGYDVTIVPCLKVGIGGAFTAEIQRADFKPKGQTLVFKGNMNGITSVVLDFAHERITVKGTAMTLTALTATSGPVKITITLDTVALGIDERAVTVKLVGAGKTLKY